MRFLLIYLCLVCLVAASCGYLVQSLQLDIDDFDATGIAVIVCFGCAWFASWATEE